MNKRVLQSYLNKNTREILKNNCFKYGDNYFISDSYSIIKLNNNYNLNIKDDELKIHKFYEQFTNDYELFSKYIPLFEKEFDNIDNDYGINLKLFSKIKNIIKANEFSILKNDKTYNGGTLYVIKLENTKTNEVAYLLPVRNF